MSDTLQRIFSVFKNGRVIRCKEAGFLITNVECSPLNPQLDHDMNEKSPFIVVSHQDL